MIEGKIIKFYRELRGLSQSELGKDICSKTHISKIERGLTEVSTETIELLAKRLRINMRSEIDTYLSLDLLLKEWYESIIQKLFAKAESRRKQLEGIVLLQIPDFYRSYTLILTRYYLLIGEVNLAQSLIDEMDRWLDHTPYDQNMLLHIKGKLFLDYQKEYNKAISFLKKIDITYYNNPEYYYDLAIAYLCMDSRVLAYYYANKALPFFTKSGSFTRIIESEMLMLIQVEQEEIFNPKDSGYPRLIEMADNLGLDHQKALLLHNYAYQQLRYGNYDKASEYYKQALKFREPSNSQYLASLEGYLNAVTKLGLSSDSDLRRLAKKGFTIANKLKDTMYKHYFQLHIYKIQKQEEQYYHYLETEAYPYFKKMGYSLATQHYAIKLLDYYMKKGEVELANNYALSFVEKYRINNELV
ncbi:helix-turn-helix domain-containing protein [Peribacillus alkalitolerans]|uniref:helix-turn-helix domain-containing protein n=1 Tax=Peribacillus alkalitolerans TaxID=1550385 RepID=UPI0013D274B5|nr:helix-turn-helix transcriptional regulator [Peribacillus alkalitolerans]